MSQTVETLENFYKTPMGDAARAGALRRLHALWPHLEGRDVLGYGYSLPYLKSYKTGAHRTVYAMPSLQGVVRETSPRGNRSVLVSEAQLPFVPGVFDRVLVAHGLEETPKLAVLLRELWRVMKPEGRIVIIVANRSGLWARSDKTPFGAGRPFSRRQLSQALKAAGFVPVVRAGALYCPPINALCGKRTAGAFEKFGETVWPGFSGLVLVEALKRMYVSGEGRQRKKILRPQFGTGGVLGAAGKTHNAFEQRQDIRVIGR